MDADELRKSQRRYKKSSSKTGMVSQESDLDDDDEDEVSTPSAEASDKNMLSLLSVR